MKIHKKRGLIVVILIIISFNIQACNNVNKDVLLNEENTTAEKKK